MMILGDLLKAESEQELNTTLKRAFFSDIPVVIDDHVSEALTILTNLTRSTSESADLLDVAAAKELYMDEVWHKGIIVTVPWVATHYLKDPNSRATGCARWFPENYGEDGQKHLGWSHNSNKVSRSHFLATEFCWNNRVTSLYEQFSKEEKSSLIDALLTLGFPLNRVQQLQKPCNGGMSNSLPDFVSPHSKVVLFPDGSGDYVAVTPLVSAGFQRWVHNLIGHPDISCRPVFYSKPFQVSSFLGTCGGRLYCLYYPPKLGRHDYNLNYLLNHWRYKKNLLNAGGIFHKKSLNFLLQLASGKAFVESEKQKEGRLKHEAFRLENIVEEAFLFLFVMRVHYLAEQSQIDNALGKTFELALIQGDLSEAGKAVEYFLSQLNGILERSHYSAQLAYNPVLLPLFEKAIKKILNKITQSV
ncbi:hypothetical protein NX722_25440 [Endozoicomonas gorgoniicola]|uniref:Uncharacterized protein n=1 Tax=Endozoicomonas gorgoniicola TaxID=1234144 RepID=A0ABT3N2R2_9GAMM|nr:hypothetical protein [Endozoicomonas gorgoniicola]MCW7555912.1 hypothetical protein [Endozoicomonas gorgoniicola]